MKNEIIQVLSEIKDVSLIANIIQNMNSRDISILQSLLDYTDIETQNRWLSAYSQLMKY